MSKRSQTPPDDELRVAVAAVEAAGYEVRFCGAGSDGRRKWVVHRPDPTTGSGYNPRNYFDRDGLLAAAGAGSKQGIRDAVAAGLKTNNPYINLRSDKDMTTKEAKKQAAKRAAKKTTALIEKQQREARAAKKGGAKPAAGKGGTKPEAAGKAAKAKAARAPKAQVGDKRPGGADVPGATPEILERLAGYQGQTIERMNGRRVVETFIQISGSTLDKPVTHKSLSPYPARIARELVRLGLAQTEKVPDVGLVYLPA